MKSVISPRIVKTAIFINMSGLVAALIWQRIRAGDEGFKPIRPETSILERVLMVSGRLKRINAPPIAKLQGISGEAKAMRIDLNSEVMTSESMPPMKAGSRPSEPTAASNSEAAELSSQDLSAAALTAAVAQFPEVRQEKVAALAEQVRSGTYEVNARKTAEAMLAQMRAA